MADGSHLETWTNGHILARVWPISAKFGKVTLIGYLKVWAV